MAIAISNIPVLKGDELEEAGEFQVNFVESLLIIKNI